MTSVAGTPPNRLDFIPGGPLNNMVLREAVRRVAENVAADGQRYPAIGALLAKQYPRLVGLKAGAHSYSAGNETGGSEEAAKFKRSHAFGGRCAIALPNLPIRARWFPQMWDEALRSKETEPRQRSCSEFGYGEVFWSFSAPLAIFTTDN